MKTFLAAFLFCTISVTGLPQSTTNIRVLAYYLGGPEDLDNYNVNQMTHIIFCFGQLNGSRYAITARDSATIKKIVSLKQKNPQLKVIISLGGGRGCKTCSDVFATEQGRKEFAQSILDFHRHFRTDGLDLDWEFPFIEHFPGQKHSPADVKNFTLLVKELRRSTGDKYELSFAAGAHEGIFKAVTEWKKVMKYMDYVNLMTYDIGSYQNRPKLPQYRHLSLGSDSKNTGHHTALYSTPDQLHSIPGRYAQFSTQGQERSVDFCVKYLLDLGIPREKLIVGAAFYGRMYEDVKDMNNGLYMPGEFTGTVAFRNYATELSADDGYVHHWDDIAKAPYAYNPSKKIFVTYEDKRSVELKTRYVIDNKLGGIMFWQLRNDTNESGMLDIIDRVKKGERSGVSGPR
ncbi:MAG: glycosyl hydrolase family 18 protein [Cyclobacteriaceae bacterium]